jgi:tripartite-type tricarboxylate transporter receptor subunit TctC
MKKLLLTFLFLCSSLTQASEDIVLWVSISPGGPTDQVARHVQNYVQPLVTNNVSVYYKPGAGGILGMTGFAQTTSPNKIDLLVANEQVLIHRYLTKKLSDKDFKELDPVAYIGQTPFVLVSNTKSGLTDFNKLMQTKTITNGVAGVGTFSHLIHVLLEKQLPLSFTSIQYQGTAKILPDLLGGHISTAILFPGSVISHSNTNQITVLAISGHKRWAKLPGVPTFQELNLELPMGSFWAIFIRAGSEHKLKIQKILYQAINNSASKEILVEKMHLSLQPEPDLARWWVQNNQYYRNLSSRYDFRTMEVD